MTIPRRPAPSTTIFARHGSLVADPGMAAGPRLTWYAPWERPFRLSGFPWFESERLFRRLPRKPQDALPPLVDRLANDTAGGQVAFGTDSRVVWLRAWLTNVALHDHFAATGNSGFDLYVGAPGRQRFYHVTRFPLHANAYESNLFQAEDRRWRTFTLNFPLYQAVAQVAIGLERGARLRAPSAWSARRPIVIYGTSITQGGCASRPGMAYPNILSRRLNREVINLGFSGSGQAEPDVARVMASIPRPALLAIDCEANCGYPAIKDRLPEFVRILRQRHPTVPILIVSRIRFARDAHQPASERRRRASARFQRALVARGRAAGDRHLHFLDGAALLGPGFDECTVDGVHATDLGFQRMADAMTPVIGRLLAGHSATRGERRDPASSRA